MDGKEGEIPPGEVKITWGRAGTQLDLELAWSPGPPGWDQELFQDPSGQQFLPQHQPGAGIRDPEPPTSNNANSRGAYSVFVITPAQMSSSSFVYHLI